MSNLQVQVEKVEKKSNILRQLKVRVPAAVVSSRLERGLREVQKTAKLKGFRPGHVPMPVVKQFYGEDVRHQVFHDLIDESFQEAVRGEKLRAVGRPQIETPEHKTGAGEHDHAIEEGKDLSYLATVEVMPDIEVKGYTGIALTRESTKVEKDDVKKIVDNFLNAQAQLIPTADSHKARKGDSVEIKFEGGIVVDGKVEARAGMSGSRMLEIGSDSLIPGFEDELVGMQKGDTKTFKIDFPNDFYEKDLAGKPASFTVDLLETKEKKLPELNDEFAKQMGYESLSDLNQKIEEHVGNEKKAESDRKLRSDLLQALIDKNTFEVPAALVQAQARALANDVAQNLKRQGADDKAVQEILMSEMANISKKAEGQVKASLLVEAVAKAEKFEVTSEDLDAEISKMATSMKVEEPKVKEFYLNNPSRRDDLEYRIREERTLGWLLEKAKIKDAK